MGELPIVVIATRDAEIDADTRAAIEKRCADLYREFPEITHFEVTLTYDGKGHVAHARVTGKHTEVVGQASAAKLPQAADRLLDTLEKQLRRAHDRRISTRRRSARRNPPKRS